MQQYFVLLQCLLFLVFAGDENRAMLLELGAVERLLKHITSEEKTVRRNSVMVLGVLSTHRKLLNVCCLQIPSKFYDYLFV